MYANGECIQVHPTAIPGGRQAPPHLGERARRRWPRLGPEGRERQALSQGDPRERARLRARAHVPRVRKSGPARHRFAGHFKTCYHEGRGIYNPVTAKNENEVYLDLTHKDESFLRNKLAGILEIYEKFVGVDPYHNPMKVFPAVHYSNGRALGGLRGGRARIAQGGITAQPRDQHPGPSMRSARSSTSTTAQIGSARTRSSRASTAGW